MISEEEFVLGYQYFYSKIYKNPKYIFLPTDRSRKLIIKLQESISKEKVFVRINFLWVYLLFQFHYYEQLEFQEKDFNSRIVPSFILGIKSWERWKSRDETFDWSIEDQSFLSKYDLSKLEFLNLFNTKEKRELNESHFKRSHYNTDRGFNNCLVFTTLYNNRDFLCLNCSYKIECKQLLKANFPKLYTKRGYK